mmetsp:Transcript_5500/g.11394  ORF Transcript_5500/g.11394 Transcript_5500/m.11394 type:complete len:784 (+) Transcript_5500:525-2876(+)
MDYLESQPKPWSRSPHRSKIVDECLTISKKSWKQHKKDFVQMQLELDNCGKKRSRKWYIDSRGVLTLPLPARKNDGVSSGNVHRRAACLSRNNTEAVVTLCEETLQDIQETVYPVTFSLVSYKHIYTQEDENIIIDIAPDVEDLVPDDDEDSGSLETAGIPRAASLLTSSHPILLGIPASKTLSSAHPSRGSLLLKNSNPILVGINNENLSSSRPSRGTLLLTHSNPILHGFQQGSPRLKDSKPRPAIIKQSDNSAPLVSPGPGSTTTRIKTCKMPVNPYFEAADDAGMWEDPATSLVYRTEISSYLGDDESLGRHVLMGVGQYMRTVFNVKIYGIGLYVSELDAVADPQLRQFVGLDAEDMRGMDKFYEVMSSMGDKSADSVGFDRTLLLKLNMQLSTDTMRSSLEGDWKLMTPEQKDMLISSSMKPRPADENMLKVISSKHNPSKCSCGQFAPEEYNADSSCCARGTDMLFTWRKNGDVELRIDGRPMDIFSYPDLGQAIFYDYFRFDDPISQDALFRFPDGFPSLLAPLAQVPTDAHTMEEFEEKTDLETKLKKKNAPHIGNIAGNIAKDISGHVVGATGWIQTAVTGATQEVISRTQALGGEIQRASHQLDDRRRAIADATAASVTSFVPFVRDRFGLMLGNGNIDEEMEYEDDSEWSGGKLDGIHCVNMNENEPCSRTAPVSIFENDAPQSSEHIDIGEADPSITLSHKVVLMIVHLYLALLLIVSLPGDSDNCMLVIKRKRKLYRRGQKKPNATNGFDLDSEKKKQGNMKKSLSYFL